MKIDGYYRIVRIYENDPGRKHTVRGKARLTLAEARKHCTDPETSSRTCTSPAGHARTRLYGPWFDAFEAHRA